MSAPEDVRWPEVGHLIDWSKLSDPQRFVACLRSGGAALVDAVTVAEHDLNESELRALRRLVGTIWGALLCEAVMPAEEAHGLTSPAEDPD